MDPLTVEVEIIVAQDDVDVLAVLVLDIQVGEGCAVWDELQLWVS